MPSAKPIPRLPARAKRDAILKDATVKRFHDDSHDQFRQHLADFGAACNFARRLRTLGGLTPYEAI